MAVISRQCPACALSQGLDDAGQHGRRGSSGAPELLPRGNTTNAVRASRGGTAEVGQVAAPLAGVGAARRSPMVRVVAGQKHMHPSLHSTPVTHTCRHGHEVVCIMRGNRWQACLYLHLAAC